jgi:ABC-type transporter Mla subunit MlaD
MAAQGAMIDIQPLDAAFEGASRETTEAIKSWVMDQLNARMELVGRAADYLNSLDIKRLALEQHANEQVDRVNTVVADLQVTKDDVKKLFEEIKLKMDTVDVQLQSVPELTQKLNEKTVQIDELFKKTDSLLKEKTEQIQANETKVNDLFEKTEQFYEKTRVSFEKVIDDLETTKGGILGETIKLKNKDRYLV